jgi:uncharacterized protein YbdZ (MbtH family)
MAKIIIKKENLPSINPTTESYSVRYRLTTEDRNRFSYWSPIFDIPANISYTTVSGSVTHVGDLVTVIWENVPNVSTYDIWVAWATGTTPTNFIYYGTFPQNMVNIFNPSTYNRFSVKVYVSNQDTTQQYSNFLIYENSNIHI